MFTIANAELLNCATNLIGLIWGIGGHVKVKLFDVDATPTVNSTAASFHEASYTGYAAVNQTGTIAAHMDAVGNVLLEGSTMPSFAPSGVLTSPVTIYGYFLLDNTNQYIGAERFQTPVILSDTTTVLTFAIAFALKAGSWTAPVLP